MRTFYHEFLHRGPEFARKAASLTPVICGAGALGGTIAEHLARTGFPALTIIDRDRVEEHNLSTQPYQRADIGAFKAVMLGNMLYRAVGTRVEAMPRALTGDNVRKLLRGAALVIDAFDNSESRRTVAEWCSSTQTPCLHAGLSADGYAEVLWNEVYRIPSAVHDDICDYPLARSLAVLAATVACETLVEYVLTGARNNYTVTLRDLAIRPLMSP